MRHQTDDTLDRPLGEPDSAPRWRAALRGPVVAGVGVLAVLIGASAAAAVDWLPIFRTEQVAAVPISRADLVQLPDLARYGDVDFTQKPDFREVGDGEAAGDATGLSAPDVRELPRGVTGKPQWLVGERVSAQFTFSAEEAAGAAGPAGDESVPAPPEGLDGSRFRLVAGPGLAAVWSSESGAPALAVARVVAPTASSSGASFETARDYLLSLPGVPSDLASQLRSFSGVGSTLPLVVPSETMESAETEVAGTTATLLTSRDGAMSAVVWVDDGVVTGVAGSLSADEVLSVARGLQTR